jgi:hypothetical protein
MRVFLACAFATVAAAALVIGISSCGDKVQSGLTGIDIKVSFESDLQIRRLRFAGFVGHELAFPLDDRPHAGDSRELDPEDENLIVLLPDVMGEPGRQQMVFVRVDGVDSFGSILASAGASQLIEQDKILTLVVHLGQPRVCGDGAKHPTAEQCDDGNQLGSDGCSGECVVETGWTCEGAPSVCRTCGDGVCSVGEDHCSCRDDCEGIATCGDGLCCPGRDESVCSCPQDCLDEGAVTCPDGFCCPDERAAGNCEPDCGDCGNGTCETDKGEDVCTCSQDCPEGSPMCGNDICCGGETMASCQQDCCEDTPIDGDGTCCPVESAENAPQDCCATQALCGDNECCPGEEEKGCPECCANVCGDGVCCGNENITDCPQDCCPGCGDLQACTGCCSEECTGGSCGLECEPGCSCYFECSGAEGCDVTCTASSCQVQCTGEKQCHLTCRDGVIGGDAGVGADVELPSACYCNGPGCVLDCPPGKTQVECGDGGIACGPASCP